MFGAVMLNGGPVFAAPPSTPTPTPTSTSPAPGSRQVGGVTVTEVCGGQVVRLVVRNPTAAAVPVTVTNFGQDFDSFTVPAGGEHSVQVDPAGAPFELVFTRDDTGEVLFRSGSFLCHERVDFSFVVTAGTTFVSSEICFPSFFLTRRPAHGGVQVVQDPPRGAFFRYTPTPGFLGLDSFDYECSLTSANQGGTVRLRVVAAPPTTRPAAQPPAAQPPADQPPADQAAANLPNTGASGLPRQLGIGIGLLCAGTVLAWLGRRRYARGPNSNIAT